MAVVIKLNRYVCAECETEWFDLGDCAHDCVCEAHCPACGDFNAAEASINVQGGWLWSFATEEEMKEAEDQWGIKSDDINIDTDARVSRADEGFWIQGWLWVQGEEEDEDA